MDTDAQAVALPPYDTLAREHRLIERALDVLARFSDEVRRTKTLDAPVASEILTFFRDFADLAHHLKEERVLFPAIDAADFFPGCGLLDEHQLGRRRIRTMAEAVERSSRGDADAPKVFVQQARSYINLLRSHIAKEDDCLAKVTARTIRERDRLRLAREFDELERREVGERVFERYTAVVDALEARLGVRDPAE